MQGEVERVVCGAGPGPTPATALVANSRSQHELLRAAFAVNAIARPVLPGQPHVTVRSRTGALHWRLCLPFKKLRVSESGFHTPERNYTYVHMLYVCHVNVIGTIGQHIAIAVAIRFSLRLLMPHK